MDDGFERADVENTILKGILEDTVPDL